MKEKKETWTLQDLKNQLNQHAEVKGWMISEEHVHRRERYFMMDHPELKSGVAIDQDRTVQSKNIILRLFVHLSQPQRQGEITKKLFPSLPIQEQIRLAVEAAKQTDHQAWELPTSFPSELPQLKTTDPRMAEDLDGVMNDLTSQIRAAAETERAAEFNSAELFLNLHDREVHCSNGLKYRSSQSRIYGEAAFSYSKPSLSSVSDEYLNTFWAVSLQDFSVETLFHQAASRAEASLDVCKPASGKYSVIIDAEVLSELMDGCLSQLSASSAYHGLPFFKPGSEFIPHCEGDLISISLDPSLEFGAHTIAISDQGIPQSEFKLIEKNRVIATAANKQYADYLNLKPTPNHGNLVMDPGELTIQELTESSPQVIEILQFSGLFTDPVSGTFSSEIRLARLYDNQNKKVTYLKGGSLSGSIRENFQGIRLSNQRVKRCHFTSESPFGRGYFGPEYALLTNVSIVG